MQANPAAVLLSGPGYGLDDYTLGAMVANEVALAVMVAAAIMSIQLVVRNTRAEEESGRAELVRAGVVGRRAALTAALLETALANAAIAAGADGRARGHRPRRRRLLRPGGRDRGHAGWCSAPSRREPRS